MTDDRPDPQTEAPLALNLSPINPLPWPVWALILAIAGGEALLWLGGAGLVGGPEALGWRVEAIRHLAVSAALQDWMIETGRAPWRHLLRYLAFGLVHGGPLHALFVIVLLAALGKYLGEAMGWPRLLALMILPPAAGALVFGLALGGAEQGWLFGGMAMVFGLVGALTFWRWREARDAAGRRRAFAIIGALVLARLGFGLLAETGQGWIAEIAACAAGFALAALLAPGALARLRRR